MSITIGSNFITIPQTWSQLKTTLFTKGLSLQWDYDSTGTQYQLFAIDSHIVYTSFIYLGTVPDTIAATYSQVQNSIDLTDFQNNFKSGSNLSIVPYQPGDNRWIYRLGNLASTGSGEQLVSVNNYYEQATQGQRSITSTSANDTLGGSGAQAVRIYYLDNNYAVHQEDINLSGTNVVSTVNTNIRFIERFEVTRGVSAAGRIILHTSSNGLGEICSIGAANTDAFLCHHYIPSGSQAQTIEWDVTTNSSVNMKLKGQQWISGSLIDPIFYDLENISVQSGSSANFIRTFRSQPAEEKTRIYITAVPQQAIPVTIRARLNIWQDYLYVSGTT